MPHVDEGTLHAYLDGAIDALVEAGALPRGTTRATIEAHLTVCADCRALLEAERGVREQAGAVLQDAAPPAVDVPPFPVTAQVAVRRAPARLLPLAWAASVMLAVGAGWWGSALFRGGVVQPEPSAESLRAPDRREAAGPVADMEAAGAAASSAAAAEVQAPAPTAGDVATAEPPRARTEGRATTDVTGPPAAMPDAAVVAAPPPAAPPMPVSAEAMRAAGGTARVAADTAAVPVPRLGDAPLALNQLIVTGAPGMQAGAERALAGRPAPPLAGFALRADDAGLVRFRAAVEAVHSGDVRLEPPSREASLVLVVVEGASEPRVETGGYAGATITRVTQRLATGEEVELLVWRDAPPTAAAAPAARAVAEAAREAVPAFTVLVSGARADGGHELIVRRHGSDAIVGVRAPLSAAELRELQERLVERAWREP